MKFKVRFLPDHVVAEFVRGTTVLDAASKAGVEIQTTCGGKGTCRKCKVIVEGESEMAADTKMDKEIIEKGYRLACQTYVTGDITVHVPEEARVKEGQILTAHPSFRPKKLEPMTRALDLHLPRPGQKDNLGDLERLARALGKEAGQLRPPVDLLRLLPRRLRDLDWKVNALLAADDLGGEMLDILPEGSCHLGAALDIGTTTVVLSLVDLEKGDIISTASDYNKQMRLGDDVITRISYAEEGGLDELREQVLQTINQLVLSARANAPELVADCDISALSVAGNTTMIHLFLGLEPKHIRYDPYIPTTNVPPLLRGKETGLVMHPEGLVYCIPGRASFVGGDVTADVIASGMHGRSEFALLIDVGTNGEVVLGNQEFLVGCSTSAGPAFEGGEVACGMRAMSGAIEKVCIDEELETQLSVIGDAEPLGVCGSGLIDLLAQMFRCGLVDRKGRIQGGKWPRVRQTEIGPEYVVAFAEKGKVKKREIVIREDDIANLIRTKAALYAGCSVLLKSVDKEFSQLDRVYIAGGFGNYIGIENAVLIGLLPDLPRDRFEFIGNGALAGAVQTLLSAEKRFEARQVYDDMTYIELSNSQLFFNEFSSASFLPHTDLERFPSVARQLGKK